MQKYSKGVEHKPSQSAQGAAFIRALAAREFKLGIWGSDNLAENFLNPNYINILRNPNNMRVVKKTLSPGMYNYIIARTVFFDRIFKEALNENCPQIVFLGAGYDTRAYRFHDLIMETQIFELDIHLTQQRKKECLIKTSIHIPDRLVFVPINFNTDSIKDVLVDAGYNKDLKTFFIWEGVIYYLHPEAVDNTLDFVKLNSPPGSTIAFDYSRDMKDVNGARETVFMKSTFSEEPMIFTINESMTESFLKERGFKIIEHHTPEDIEKNILTSKDGVFLGQTHPLLCFVLASILS